MPGIASVTASVTAGGMTDVLIASMAYIVATCVPSCMVDNGGGAVVIASVCAGVITRDMIAVAIG